MSSNEQNGAKRHLQQICHIPEASLWNRWGGAGGWQRDTVSLK